MQAPILMAIVEYGIVLGMKMYWQNKTEISLGGNKFKIADMFKSLDVFTFYVSIVVLSLFNIFYWSYYI